MEPKDSKAWHEGWIVGLITGALIVAVPFAAGFFLAIVS